MHENGSDVAAMRFRGLFGHEHFAGPQERAAALAWVAARGRRWGPLLRIEVAVPASRCLIRRRELPVAAAERIADVLALEVERTTPFDAEDVRQGWLLMGPAASGAAHVQVAHVIAKRTLIDPLLLEAQSLGLAIASVDVMDPDRRRMGINLLRRSEVPHSLAGRLHGAIGIAFALFLCVSAALVFIALDRQQHALAGLGNETRAARTEAEGIRKRLGDFGRLRERIGQLRLRRANGVRVVALWEAVTRLLPDSAWLTDLRVENDTLWLDGYARNAPELIGILAQSPLFSGVALSSPVVREEARASERFQIRLKIEAAGAADVSKREAR